MMLLMIFQLCLVRKSHYQNIVQALKYTLTVPDIIFMVRNKFLLVLSWCFLSNLLADLTGQPNMVVQFILSVQSKRAFRKGIKLNKVNISNDFKLHWKAE